MIEISDFFEILWVYVTFGVDYESVKKSEKTFFWPLLRRIWLFLRPKIHSFKLENFFLVRLIEKPSISNKITEFKKKLILATAEVFLAIFK